MIAETKLVDDKQLREQYINRLEVLDKVKNLLLIPEMECMTVQQVADYYGVSIETIKKQYLQNADEFIADGVSIKTPVDFKKILMGKSIPIKKMEQLNGKLVVAIDDNVTLVIPNRGIKVFPKRAILRMGMLLRDSKIAKEVRTQLLNIAENVQNENPELLTKEIETEQELYLDIGKAFATGDMMQFAEATQRLTNYQNRHIEKLQQENKLLSAKILKWTDRASANRLIRVLNGRLHKDFKDTFGIVYKELLYKYGINVKARGEKPYLQHIKDNEWICLYKTIAALCDINDINISELFAEAKIDVSTLCLE